MTPANSWGKKWIKTLPSLWSEWMNTAFTTNTKWIPTNEYQILQRTTTCSEQEILIEIQESNRNDYRNNWPTASTVIELFVTKNIQTVAACLSSTLSKRGKNQNSTEILSSIYSVGQPEEWAVQIIYKRFELRGVHKTMYSS